MIKPVLFVTGHAPPDRVGAFAALHERENLDVALFGGRLRHGGGRAGGEDPAPAFPHRLVRQRSLYALAASGRYRAVIVSTGGRVALPAAWLGARRAAAPVILWASLWSHPQTPAHAASYPILLGMYRGADAVVTYGPHVSAYVVRRGARNVHVAPQAVDDAFWRAPADPPSHPAWPSAGGVKVLFVGRAAREKGIGVLLGAWRELEPARERAFLLFAGVEPHELARLDGEGRRLGPLPPTVRALGPVGPGELRNFYAAADVLVVPSLRTRQFREPWGLVVNEAFNRGLPVIASTEVGAVAGGLVRDGRNGLVVRAADAHALAEAIGRLIDARALRERLGAAAAADVRGYTHEAWASGFSAALASVGRSAADGPGGDLETPAAGSVS